MAPPVQAGNRNKRKRKRKAVEFSSSESSSSDSDDEQQVAPTPPTPAAPETAASSTVSSDSSDSSDSDSDDEPPVRRQAAQAPPSTQAGSSNSQHQRPVRASSRSPSPPPTKIPSFLPERTVGNEKLREEKDKAMKERFRKLWMTTVADEFKSDLEEIRKEPGLTQSRLAMLIDSLASVGEGFSSGSAPASGLEVNEMELVLDADDLAKAVAS